MNIEVKPIEPVDPVVQIEMPLSTLRLLSVIHGSTSDNDIADLVSREGHHDLVEKAQLASCAFFRASSDLLDGTGYPRRR